MTFVNYSPTTSGPTGTSSTAIGDTALSDSYSTTATSTTIRPSFTSVRVTSWDGQVYDLPVQSVTLNRTYSTLENYYSWGPYTTGTTLTFSSSVSCADYETLSTLAYNDASYRVIVDGVTHYQDSGILRSLTSNFGTDTAVQIHADVEIVPGSGLRARETEEERAAREAQAAEYRRQSEDRAAQRNKANEEAEALLWACLDNVQRGELAITDSFVVTASSGKRYRIRRGYAGNVEDCDGETIYSYCGHAYIADMPDADQMLAQKFALETDEEGYRRIANASYLRPGTVEERERDTQGSGTIERGRPGAEAHGRRIA